MKDFEEYLLTQEYAPNTIVSYLFAAKQLEQKASPITNQSLLDHKEWLVSSFAPKTANNRIGAINVYLDFLGFDGMRLKGVKVQQKPFLNNVISNEEYRRLRDGLKRDEDWFWYFVVRFLACTGVRVSELRRFEYEHVVAGHMDIISKGQKLRRIYVPAILQDEAVTWCECEGKSSGVLFGNQSALTSRAIALGLKRAAERYGVNPDVVYPHSFRHLFAKNFIAKNSDIAFLADLMGHESIETTRIYLRRTAAEQRSAVDAAIDW